MINKKNIFFCFITVKHGKKLMILDKKHKKIKNFKREREREREGEKERQTDRDWQITAILFDFYKKKDDFSVKKTMILIRLARGRKCKIRGFFALENNFVRHLKPEVIRSISNHESFKGAKLVTTRHEKRDYGRTDHVGIS